MTVRNYAILYVGGKRTRGGTVVGGGTIVEGGNGVLQTGQHALAGSEHTSVDILNLPTAEMDDELVLAPDGLGGVEFRVEVGGSGDDVPWSYAKADGGLVGDGVTDDTAAFQTWIDTVTAAGTVSGWFFFEPGIYIISGALQDTGAFNGQILLPDVADADDGITITFQGPGRPQYNLSWGSGEPVGGAGYAILKSTLTGGTGTAACISAGNSGTTNNIQVNIINLYCQAPNNPTFTFWNLADTWNGLREGLFITTAGMWTNTYVEPTNTNAYGIKLPKYNNSALGLEDIFVCQFYTGIKTGELNDGHLLAWLCAIGVEFPFSYHVGFSGRIQVGSCPIGMLVTGENQVQVQYDAEHALVATGGPNNPAWAVTTADLSDTSDELTGEIVWWGVEAGVGVDHTFTIDGGANVQSWELGDAPTGGGGGAVDELTIRESANDGSDFSNPAADYRLFYLGEDGGFHLLDSAGGLTHVVPGVGSSFPASPNTGDRFYRSDKGVVYLWDGTRWRSTGVSQFQMLMDGALPLTVTATSRAAAPITLANGIWLIRTQSSFFVNGGTALAAGHKWVGVLTGQPSGTVYDTVNIDSGASSVWRQSTITSIGAVLASTDFALGMTWTKTGTPGNLFVHTPVAFADIAT